MDDEPPGLELAGGADLEGDPGGEALLPLHEALNRVGARLGLKVGLPGAEVDTTLNNGGGGGGGGAALLGGGDEEEVEVLLSDGGEGEGVHEGELRGDGAAVQLEEDGRVCWEGGGNGPLPLGPVA